ncbi:hypothetical protein [Frankia sp. B2]|uniref:hypothetical protein n=1 Tax=Frankia sp. B2 TaxID=2541730 RepID=UPI001F0F4C98|nr:hypothetical protein [Frankia sp. B2]
MFQPRREPSPEQARADRASCDQRAHPGHRSHPDRDPASGRGRERPGRYSADDRGGPVTGADPGQADPAYAGPSRAAGWEQGRRGQVPVDAHPPREDRFPGRNAPAWSPSQPSHGGSSGYGDHAGSGYGAREEHRSVAGSRGAPAYEATDPREADDLPEAEWRETGPEAGDRGAGGPEDIRPDEVWPDEVWPDEVWPDEVRPDEVRPDEVRPDEPESAVASERAEHAGPATPTRSPTGPDQRDAERGPVDHGGTAAQDDQVPQDGSADQDCPVDRPGPDGGGTDLVGSIGAVQAVALERLASRVDELARLRRHDTQLVDRLHAENARLRSGELTEAMAPLLRGLIRLHDQMGSLGADDPQSVAGILRKQLLQVLDVAVDVRPYTAVPGGTFDPARHLGVRRVPTDDPGRDGTIARTVRPGFVRGETTVVRPAETEVYRSR